MNENCYEWLKRVSKSNYYAMCVTRMCIGSCRDPMDLETINT